eukprot:10124783-Prorocentrum_lima.AAC.1
MKPTLRKELSISRVVAKLWPTVNSGRHYVQKALPATRGSIWPARAMRALCPLQRPQASGAHVSPSMAHAMRPRRVVDSTSLKK